MQFDPLVDSEEITLVIGPNITEMIKAFDSMKPALEQLAKTLGDTYRELANAFGPFLEQLHLIQKQEMEISNTTKLTPGVKIVLEHPLMHDYVDCPVKSCAVMDRLKHIILHLNDEHKYSREEIANWLDTLDDQPIYYPQIVSDGETLQGE